MQPGEVPGSLTGRNQEPRECPRPLTVTRVLCLLYQANPVGSISRDYSGRISELFAAHRSRLFVYLHFIEGTNQVLPVFMVAHYEFS